MPRPVPALALAALLVNLVPPLAAQAPQRSVLAPTGTLRASFIATNPVHGRVDASGQPTGPAPELVRELAKRLGVPHQILPLPDAGQVLQSVKEGRVDVAFLAVEAERATQVDFADAYAESGAAYAVKADAPFQRSADIDRAGVTIAVFTGQSPAVWVQEHVKAARVQVLPNVPPNAAVGAMLLNGTVHAVAANRTRMEELVRDVAGLRVLPDDYMVTQQAIVVPKGNAARRTEVNRFLAEVRRSGFVKAVLDQAKVAGVKVAPEPSR